MRPFPDQRKIIYRLATALADSGPSFSANLRQSLGIIRKELQAEESLLQLYSSSQEAFSFGDNSGLLSRKTRKNPRWKEIARYIISNREPVQINDILNDPRFGNAGSEEESRNHALLASPLFLEEVVSKQIQEHQYLLDKKEIEINTDGPAETEALAKESLLHHLLQNLLSTAIHHTPYRGRITLSWTIKEARRKEEISPPP